MAKKSERGKKEKKTTFVLELPLVVEEGSAKRVRAHLEAARQLYNAILSEGQRRLRLMRADPAWQAARAIPHAQKQERQAAFSALREQYGFSEYALHAFARIGTSQLAGRAYRGGAGPNPGYTSLSGPQSGLCGQGQTRAL
jgi:hypothetical protein